MADKVALKVYVDAADAALAAADAALAAGKSDVGHVHTFDSLTGKPTTLEGYGITDAATEAYADAAALAAVADIIGAAPESLNTLDELASALGDNPNMAADLTALIGTKAPLVHTHAQADVTGLTASLAGKSDVGHVHAVADVTGLTAALADLDTRVDALEGAGGATLTIYVPGKNAAPHAADDGLAASSGAWTDVNWAPTAEDYDTTVKGAHFVRHAVAGGTTYRAKLKAIDAGDWSKVLDITFPMRNSAGLVSGLFLTDGVTAGAGNQNVLAVSTSSGVNASLGGRFTNFSTFGAVTLAASPWGGGGRALVRIDRLAGVYTAYFGHLDRFGGVVWTAGETWAPFGVISHYGYGYASTNSGEPLTMAFHDILHFAGAYPANGYGVPLTVQLAA